LSCTLTEIDREDLRINYVEAWKIALKAYGMVHETLEKVKALPRYPKTFCQMLDA